MRKYSNIKYWCLVTVMITGVCLAGVAKDALSVVDSTHPVVLASSGDVSETLVYRSIDGQSLELQLYRPKSSSGSLPAAMVIHGGGWSAPDRQNMARVCQHFASRGMVAVNVQYRLVNMTNNVRIVDCLTDCREAFRYIQKHAEDLGIDPRRIVVVGDSAGGHLAAAMALDIGGNGSSVPGAAVLYNPCLDLLRIKWMQRHAGIALRPGESSDSSWQERARIVSPMEAVKPKCPPFLVIHGTADGCVPIEQADRFKAAMEHVGNRVDYHRMDEWKHAFIVPGYGEEEQIVEALRVSDAFLVKSGFQEVSP